MPSLITDRAITDSDFSAVDAEAASLEASNQILPLAFYLENRDALKGRNDIGVWLEAGEDIEDLASLFTTCPLSR